MTHSQKKSQAESVGALRGCAGGCQPSEGEFLRRVLTSERGGPVRESEGLKWPPVTEMETDPGEDCDFALPDLPMVSAAKVMVQKRV